MGFWVKFYCLFINRVTFNEFVKYEIERVVYVGLYFRKLLFILFGEVVFIVNVSFLFLFR